MIQRIHYDNPELQKVMKVLLVSLNAKYIHTCLAIHSLKAYACAQEGLDGRKQDAPDYEKQKSLSDVKRKESGCIQIETAEFTINQPLDDILREIVMKEPEIVAFSCYIWNIEQTKKLACLLHLCMPDLPIWAGGPEVSFNGPEVLKENPAFTGIISGEGELSFAALLQAYKKAFVSHKPFEKDMLPVTALIEADLQNNNEVSSAGQNEAAIEAIQAGHTSNNIFLSMGQTEAKEVFLSDVPGIIFRGPHGEIITNPAPLPLDMDTLPFAYPDADMFSHRILYYESSRGCPFNCSYCLSSVDRQVRFKSLEKVYAELEIFLKHRIPLVKFVDRTFNCDHKRTLAIWQYIKDHDNGITRFHFEITADLLNEEELKTLNSLRPGLVQLEIGVQSANPETLKAIHRSQDLSKLARVTASIFKGRNVHQHLDLIAGLPYEGLESFSRSFDTVYKMKPSQLQLGFLKLLTGSEMHRLKDHYGLICRPWPPYEVVSTRWISAKEILFLKNIDAMVETYYNSGQFSTALKYLEHFFDRPWDLFSELATWMEKNGQLHISHARLSYYDLLREFAKTILQEGQEAITKNEHTASPKTGQIAISYFDQDAFDAILLYDLYLRENLKSRPDWAPLSDENRKRAGELFSQESFRAQYLPEFTEDSVRQIRHETHLEFFDINILKAAETGITEAAESERKAMAETGISTASEKEMAEKTGLMVLFNYRRRDPLDNSAAVMIIH